MPMRSADKISLKPETNAELRIGVTGTQLPLAGPNTYNCRRRRRLRQLARRRQIGNSGDRAMMTREREAGRCD